MPEVVWLNGRMTTRTEARVSAFDASVQHGVGLFETMTATQGRVFRMESHLARLARSAGDLGLSASIKAAALGEIVQSCVEASELAEGEARARVRLTLTGGDLNLLAVRRNEPTDPTLMIAVTPGTAYPPEMFDRGVGVLVPEARASRHDSHAGHKTLNYWWRLNALQQASHAGMGECLILTDTNHVCGGAVSNLFIVKDGTLGTPVARGEEGEGQPRSPVLPGVTRDAVREFAAGLRIGCDTRLLDIASVLDADEVFLTNSSWGVLPVVRVEGRVIGSGEPGEVTRRVRRAWLEALRDEP